jgi:hypothetical protein
VVTPQTALPAGAIDGTGSVGFGTGAYGAGPWGETPADGRLLPADLEADCLGPELVFSAPERRALQSGVTTPARAVAVDGAPTQITHMLVAPMNGGYMLLSRWADQPGSRRGLQPALHPPFVRSATSANGRLATSTSREYTLTGAGRIVAGRMCGPYLLVWTSDALFLGTYTGALDLPWRFERVGRNCGLIGPERGHRGRPDRLWASPDRQFYSYGLGGQPQPMPCPIRVEYAENLAAAQGDKVVASSNAEFSEIASTIPTAATATRTAASSAW